MPVGILDVHLERPWIISGRNANDRSARLVLRVQLLNILHTGPHPCSAISLRALAEVKTASVAADSGEKITPWSLGEAEDVNVIRETAFDVRDAENRLNIFEAILPRGGF